MPNMLSSTSFRAVTLAERNVEIMRLRRTTTMTLEQIGNEVGCDKAMVHRVIKKAVAGMMEREVGELRVHEIQRLQRMEDDASEQAYRFFAALDDKGKPIMEPLYDAGGLPICNGSGQPLMVPKRDYDVANQGKALLLKISEQRSKLLGLYAPEKVQQLTDENGAPRQITFSVVTSENGRRVVQEIDSAPSNTAPEASPTMHAPAHSGHDTP